MKELERIKILEDELALLKADLMEKEKQPIAINRTLDFLVHPTELGKMNWKDAMKACAELGDGWRLPTRVELLLMYENKDMVGGFANINYWSSTEVDNVFAWIQLFDVGFLNFFNKVSTYYVRAVKTI